MESILDAVKSITMLTTTTVLLVVLSLGADDLPQEFPPLMYCRVVILAR